MPLASAPGQLSVVLTFLIVLGAALLSGLLLLVALSNLDGPIEVGANTLPLLMGVGLSGQFSGKASVFIVEASIGYTLLPLGTLTAVGAGVFLLARRRRRLDGSVASTGLVAMRSATEALAVALVTALLLGLFKGEVRTPDPMELSGSFLGVFLLVLLVVFAGLFLGRAGDILSQRAPQPVAQLFQELAGLVQAIALVLGPLTLIGAVVGFVSNDMAAMIAVVPVFFLNMVTVALVLGTFGAVTVDSGGLTDVVGGSGSGDSTQTYLAWDLLGAWSVLLFLVMVVFVVVAAARVGVRRQRLASTYLARTWQLPVLAWLVSLVVVHLLVPMHASIKALGTSGSMGAGLTWWSTLTLALALAAISVLAELVPGLMYSGSGGLLAMVAGAKATQRWLYGQPVGAATAAAGAAVAPGAGAFPQAAQAVPGVRAPGGASQAVASTGAFSPEAQAVPTAPVPGAEPPVAGGTAPLPAPTPMDPATHRRVRNAFLALGLLLALVAGGVIGVQVANSSRTAEKEVRRYLQLVADGKASAATEMVDPGVPNSERGLLTDEALQEAAARVVIENVKEEGAGRSTEGTKTVLATFTIDGERHEQRLVVEEGDKEYGLLRTWKVVTPAIAPVRITSSSQSQVVVAGVTFDLPEKDRAGVRQPATAYAYFGVYSVGLTPEASAYADPSETKVQVEPQELGARGDGTLLTVEGKANQALKDKVLEAVNKRAEECVTPPGNLDMACAGDLRRKDLAAMSVKEKATEVDIDEQGAVRSGPVVISTTENATTWNKSPRAKEKKYRFSGRVVFPKGGGEPTIDIDGSDIDYGF